MGWEDQCGGHRFHGAAPWRRVSSSVCKAAAGIQRNLLNIKHQAPAGVIFLFFALFFLLNDWIWPSVFACRLGEFIRLFAEEHFELFVSFWVEFGIGRFSSS